MAAPEERYDIGMIKIEVHEGKLPRNLGIGTILFGILIAVMAARDPVESAALMRCAYMMIMLIICAGIWFCMDGRNRRLTVEDMKLCYTDWRGRKKTFSLDEIAYCKAAFENEGSKDYIKLYDFNNEKLCKLEFNMKNSTVFLEYLLDNQIKVECTNRMEETLKNIINTKTLCPEEIPAAVNGVFEEVKKLVEEWVKKNKGFGVEWKMGIAEYLYQDVSWEKQLWEQKGYEGALNFSNLPEGYIIGIEGYLQKDGQFVVNKKNQTVAFFFQLISISKSYQIGEELTVRFWGNNILEKLSEELAFWADRLPRKRYHPEQLVLRHELKEKINSV
ncbi:MAG: hypothetical protein K2J04_08640 [Lachnospiraceae bacterium]|nr:hypothetical protein [Lachnospiraceae bacterium]